MTITNTNARDDRASVLRKAENNEARGKHTHTHTHESNPGKTRKNATLENAGPTEITEACRQTAGAPTRGIRLQTSQHLTRRKIGIAHASAPRTHAHTHTFESPSGKAEEHAEKDGWPERLQACN